MKLRLELLNKKFSTTINKDIRPLILILTFSLILAACSPDNIQIQEATHNTPTSSPTNTQTSEPTNTPTIAPTKTPDYPYLDGLSYDDLLLLFAESGVVCLDFQVNSDGSYHQECNLGPPGRLTRGEINGNSAETVANFIIMFTPYIGEDLTEEVLEEFPLLVNFGNNGNEMKSWVTKNLNVILSDEENSTLIEEFPGVSIMIGGGNGVAILGVKAIN